MNSYKSGQEPLPSTMSRWHLYGAGLEQLGRDGQPEQVAVPTFGPNELLVRQDACGLCFSDTKVIALGGEHPRLTGRNFALEPVTLGHEVACTVVGVGANLTERFHVGERFTIQADVFYQERSVAYGYVIAGGLAEYSVIPRAVIDGDAGCYLLPVQATTGYVEAALTEPWACVVSAYAQAHRDGIRHDGSMLIIGSEEAQWRTYDWAGLITSERKPRHLLYTKFYGEASARLKAVTRPLGLMETVIDLDRAMEQGGILADPSQGFDDILLLGNVAPETIEQAARLLADDGILNLVSEQPPPRKLSLDIGRIHYNRHHYIGTTSWRPVKAYRETRTAELMPAGVAWFIGAGGPMGQMHVQRAIQSRQPPRRIVATDVDAARLQSVVNRFGSMAQGCGVELIALNPNALADDNADSNTQARFHQELHRWNEGRGFDDIVSLVPVASVIEHAADYLAAGGWFNIFAGVARGTMASFDLTHVVQARSRFVGSSGSSLADMRETLARVERQELSTNASLAAIGGMEAAAAGLRAVKEGTFPGKTLIFPLIHDLPLTPLPELKTVLPSVYALLQDGQFWTKEAEEELLRLKMKEETPPQPSPL